MHPLIWSFDITEVKFGMQYLLNKATFIIFLFINYFQYVCLKAIHKFLLAL